LELEQKEKVSAKLVTRGKGKYLLYFGHNPMNYELQRLSAYGLWVSFQSPVINSL
jgi:hypothetical protein